jgi:ribosomal protein S19
MDDTLCKKCRKRYEQKWDTTIVVHHIIRQICPECVQEIWNMYNTISFAEEA